MLDSINYFTVFCQNLLTNSVIEKFRYWNGQSNQKMELFFFTCEYL